MTQQVHELLLIQFYTSWNISWTTANVAGLCCYSSKRFGVKSLETDPAKEMNIEQLHVWIGRQCVVHCWS